MAQATTTARRLEEALAQRVADRAVGDTVQGALAGGAATIAMSAWMLLAQRLGIEAGQPPERIVEAALDAAEVDRSETMENAVASVSHLGFGGSCGVAYRWLRRRFPTPGHPVLHGIGFGLGVYAASYAGWIPALGILPPPHHDQRGRQLTMVAAHVVYGAVLGWLAEPTREQAEG